LRQHDLVTVSRDSSSFTADVIAIVLPSCSPVGC
jgi:hypothetical protein